MPAVVYEYQLFIEVNTTDADQLRNTLTSITFPVQISPQINISVADITTGKSKCFSPQWVRFVLVSISNVWPVYDGQCGVLLVCSQGDTGFQCRCEDDYLWPCDKCATYGKCDGDTNNTCGCIKAIPTDGQYCQLIQNQSECYGDTVLPVSMPRFIFLTFLKHFVFATF